MGLHLSRDKKTLSARPEPETFTTSDLSFRPEGEIFNSANSIRFLVANAPRNDIIVSCAKLSRNFFALRVAMNRDPAYACAGSCSELH